MGEGGGGARERINGPTLSLPQIPSRCRTRPPYANRPSVPSVRRFPIPALLQRMSLYLSWFVRPAAVVLKASHFLLFVSFPRPEISPNQLRTNSSSVTQMQKLLPFLLALGPFLSFGSPFVSEQPRSVAVEGRRTLSRPIEDLRSWPCLATLEFEAKPRNQNAVTFSSSFQNGHYVKEKEYEGVGIVPYDPYHNSSFVVAGNNEWIAKKRLFQCQFEQLSGEGYILVCRCRRKLSIPANGDPPPSCCL